MDGQDTAEPGAAYTGAAYPDKKGSPVVRVENVARYYQQGSHAVRALDGVSLTIRSGEFVSLAGPSGSGKSTLLNIIGGLDRPSAGRVWLGAQCLNELRPSQLATLRLTRIGFIFQAYNLIPVLSARENIEFTMQLQGVDAAERKRRSLAMLAEVGLSDLADRRPADMSGGQQQRVAVARALVTNPLLLLADEPSANLDSDTTRALLALLRHMNQAHGTTIVTATHDPIVMAYARRHVRLVDGRVAADESADEGADEGADADADAVNSNIAAADQYRA